MLTESIAQREARALLIQAMRQESVRVALERAINTADQMITELRRI
ncbi:hypothetical protein [Streptomyces sp. NPDC058874]